MVNKVTKLLLLLSPISYIPGVNLEVFDLLFFQFGVGCLFLASVLDFRCKDHVYYNRQLNSLTYLVVLGGTSVLLNSFNTIILANFVNLFLGFLVVVLVVQYVDESVLRWIYLAVGINIFFFAIQKLGWSPIMSIPLEGEEGALMGNAPRMIDYFTIVLPLLPWPLMILVGIVAFLTKELTLFVVLGVVIALKYGKWGKIATLVASCVGVLFFWPDISTSLTIRWSVWQPTLEMFFKKPLTGYGLGIFPHISSQFVVPRGYFVEYTFNSYLNLFFGVGMVAIYLVWQFICRFYKNFHLTKIHFSILAILILSFFEYPFEVPRLWITLAVLIGLYIKQEEAINES